VDYRGLNAVTQKRNCPLPRIDTCLESLGNNCLYYSLDMRAGYWQVPMKKEDVEKTCFVTRKRVFGFKVLPFGLRNAPSTFQRLVDLALAGLTWEVCLVYLDDLIVFSRTFEDHVVRLQAVFDRLRAADLKLKPTKCVLFAQQVKFLGSIVSSNGIAPDPEKVEAVATWPTPQNLTEVRAFVALAAYYHRHIRGFAEIARPLHELTRKNAPFVWGLQQEEAFVTLKERLVTAPVLAMPVDGGGFVMDTDANASSMGCVLQQWQNGVLRVISYASKAFSPAEVRYCTTRRELAAIMYGLKQYRHFLLGYPFVLRTDHAAMTFLMKTPDPVGQSARYLDRLAEYKFEVVHRPGEQHRNADVFSRRPCARDPDGPQCRQCGPENSGNLLGNLSSEENALMEAEAEPRTDLGQSSSPPVSSRSRSPVGHRHRSLDRSTTGHHWPPERYAAGCKPKPKPKLSAVKVGHLPVTAIGHLSGTRPVSSKSGGDSPGGSSTLEESSSALSDGATLEVNGEMERM